MTLDEMIQEARRRTRDNVPPFLTSDEDYTAWANEAVAEACERSFLLFDSGSPMLTLTATVGNPTLTLDPSIRMIRTVRRSADDGELCQYDRVQLEYQAGRQWRRKTGLPSGYLRDDQVLTLFPSPVADVTVKLEVYRVPVASELLENPDDRPVISHRWHPALVHWLLYRAYAVHDADFFDPKASADNYLLFEGAFGARKTARYEQVNQSMPLHARTHPVRVV